MKKFKRYRVRIEDEAHLSEMGSWRLSRVQFWGGAVAFLAIAFVIAGLLIVSTPLRTLLPGYMKESERSATEEGLMRLDSLMSAYEEQKAFINNYLQVTNTERIPSDSASITPTSKELSTDSLSEASVRERKFVQKMAEREKFNISVLAPLAADGILFSPVTSDGILKSDAEDGTRAVVILPSEENVRCTADGTVIALYHSAREGGYVIIVQHGRGFVTSYAGVGMPLVGIGDSLYSGQMIALSPTPDPKGKRSFAVRMWHNGLALQPTDYIGTPSRLKEDNENRFESPRGR